MNGNGWGEDRWDNFPSGGSATTPSAAASGGTPSDDGFDDVFHPSRHEGLSENGQTLTPSKYPFVFEQKPESNEERNEDGETKHDETGDHLDSEVKEKTLGVNELKLHIAHDKDCEVQEKTLGVNKLKLNIPQDIEEKTMVRSPGTDSVGKIWSSCVEVIKAKIASKGIGFWTMTALFGLVGILSYMRKRDRRERELLMILLHEKDQRINQLLQQIALINEIKSIVKEVAVRKI